MNEHPGHLAAVPPTSRQDLLCHHHGAALYLCGLVMTGDRTVAVRAAADAIIAVCSVPGPSRQPEQLATRRELAALMFRDYRSRPPERSGSADLSEPLSSAMQLLTGAARLQRDALALCVYGGHSASQASTLLGISPHSTYQLLLWGLRDLTSFGELAGQLRPLTLSEGREAR